MQNIESQPIDCTNDSKSVYRGYFEDLQKPLEIIPPETAKEIIENKLSDSLPNSSLTGIDQKRVKDIADTCFNKLDQHQILRGHIRGMIEGFIPALLEKKECVKSLFDPNAFIKGFDHETDEISVNDFLFQSLTRKCKPSNFSRLVYRSKRMPAIDSNKIIQNRKDGIILGREVRFNVLREMVHDQKNSALPMVSSMIIFYETGDTTPLEKEIKKWNHRYPEDDTSPFLERYLYDINFYEDRNNTSSPKIRTIDILYRLQENLSFIGFEPPTTPSDKLNQALEKTSANFSHPSIDSIRTYEESLIILNEILMSSIEKKQIGIDPSFIATATWLRDRVGRILGELPFEAIEKLYTENSLKEILRLMELISSSAKYDHSDFEKFASEYQKKDYCMDAYELIYKRTKKRVSQTDAYFRENVSCRYKFGGNLTIKELDTAMENTEKQLFGLRDLSLHKPTTSKGRDRYHSALGMS